MGGTDSSYAALDWFNNFGSGVGDFFGTVTGDFESIFKNLLGTGTSLLSSPVLLIGGGCLVLFLVVSSGGGSPQYMAASYASQYIK